MANNHPLHIQCGTRDRAVAQLHVSHGAHVGERNNAARQRCTRLATRLADAGPGGHVCTHAYGVVARHSHLASRGKRTGENDGAEAEDAYREREGDEEYHATRKRPQVVESARGGISSRTLALSPLPFCCLWICCISNHPEYQNGLKIEKGKEGATVDLHTTNHLQFVDMRKRLTNRFNIDCKDDQRLRETWQNLDSS